MIDYIQPISDRQAKEVVSKYHYSKVMPRITKLCIGGYKNNSLVAVCTFGYGVQPVATIKNMFPSLDVNDYLEIGKLCLSDELPRNSESYFLSRCIDFVKKKSKGIKILYSWADGIIGKPGYVYQSANFYYGGYIWTEMYLSENGTRVHPRTFQQMAVGEKKEGNKFHSRSTDVAMSLGYTKYFGLQFRYLYPICSKREWKQLQAQSLLTWERKDYPKDNTCKWKKQVEKGLVIECEKPPFVMTKKEPKVNNGQMSMF